MNLKYLCLDIDEFEQRGGSYDSVIEQKLIQESYKDAANDNIYDNNKKFWNLVMDSLNKLGKIQDDDFKIQDDDLKNQDFFKDNVSPIFEDKEMSSILRKLGNSICNESKPPGKYIEKLQAIIRHSSSSKRLLQCIQGVPDIALESISNADRLIIPLPMVFGKNFAELVKQLTKDKIGTFKEKDSEIKFFREKHSNALLRFQGQKKLLYSSLEEDKKFDGIEYDDKLFSADADEKIEYWANGVKVFTYLWLKRDNLELDDILSSKRFKREKLDNQFRLELDDILSSKRFEREKLDKQVRGGSYNENSSIMNNIRNFYFQYAIKNIFKNNQQYGGSFCDNITVDAKYDLCFMGLVKWLIDNNSNIVYRKEELSGGAINSTSALLLLEDQASWERNAKKSLITELNLILLNCLFMSAVKLHSENTAADLHDKIKITNTEDIKVKTSNTKNLFYVLPSKETKKIIGTAEYKGIRGYKIHLKDDQEKDRTMWRQLSLDENKETTQNFPFPIYVGEDEQIPKNTEITIKIEEQKGGSYPQLKYIIQ